MKVTEPSAIATLLTLVQLLSKLPEYSNHVAVSVTGTVPENASPPIDPSFAAFAFEERSFPFYVGTGGSPNTFTQNLINVIASKTAISPIVRVGGTSLDSATYVSDQKDQVVVPHGETGVNVPLGIQIGPSFFDSFANIPDAQYIIDLPLRKENRGNTLALAQAAYDGIPKSQQYAWEVGNEPDTYAQFRNRDGVAEYVSNWIDYTDAVTKQLGLNSSDPIYEAFTRAAPYQPANKSPWTVQNIFKDGLDKELARIKTVSIHYYQCYSGDSLQNCLMDHFETSNRVNYFAQAAQFLSQNYPGIPLVLGEVGSALNPGRDNAAARNDVGLEGVFGSALWQADFYLSAMVAGVRRINYQSGIGFGYAMWQPIEYLSKPAQVRPPFYGQVFIADFIGTGVQAQTPYGNSRTSSAGSELRVSEIPLNQEFFSAYAAFENGKLNRIALLNLLLWDSTSNTGERPNRTITLEIPSGFSSVRIERLTSTTGGLASAEGSITWGGMSWSLADNGKGTQHFNDSLTMPVSQTNLVTISVPASSAMIVYLQS